MSDERTRLLIIGAGISGLAAAKTLEDENFIDYILLEAQDYIGGRIRSVSWNNNYIEDGAQFLHGDRSKLAQYCHRNNLLAEEPAYEGQGAYIRDDGSRIDEKFVTEVNELVQSALEDCEKFVDDEENTYKVPESIGSMLKQLVARTIESENEQLSNSSTKEEIFDWYSRFLVIDNCCTSLTNLSAKYWGKFQFAGGSEHMALKNGYNSITKLIHKSLSAKNIRLKQPVKTIKWQESHNHSENSIIIVLADGRRILADCVIVTCSLGYLKEHQRELFHPPLPQSHCMAIETLGFGLINKIFLEFDEAWWNSGVKGFQLIWQLNQAADTLNIPSWTKDMTGFDVLQGHRAVLLGWVGGKGAYVVESLSEHDVAVDCVNLLRRFLRDNTLPMPRRCRRTQWNKNEYVRGSYSHITTDSDSNGVSPANLAEPVWGSCSKCGQQKRVPVIMFSGEATHEHFYSTTHGAYDSGVTQARNFLRHHVD